MAVVIHLLDTDTLIYTLRGLKAGPRQAAARQRANVIVQRCRRQQRRGGTVGVSSITISELEYGARGSDDYETEVRAVRRILAPFEAFDYDSVYCPGQYGRIRHALEAAGTSIGSLDLLIAAHALALDAVLVTNNVQHFSRVDGLQVVNWAEE